MRKIILIFSKLCHVFIDLCINIAFYLQGSCKDLSIIYPDYMHFSAEFIPSCKYNTKIPSTSIDRGLLVRPDDYMYDIKTLFL